MLSQKNGIPKIERNVESSGQHGKLDNDIYILLQPSEIPTEISVETLVNTKTERFLHIRNTNEHALNVNITIRPPQESLVELSFKSALIQAKSSMTLKITWSPKNPGFQSNLLQLTYGSHNKCDIILLMNAQVPQTDSRNQVISASMKKSSYPSRNILVSQNLSSLDNKHMHSSIDRTSNLKKIFERDFSTKTVNKKRRTEILSKNFVISPINYDSEMNISSQNEILQSMDERLEKKTQKRNNYIITPKNRHKLIKIDQNGEVNDVFDDLLSSSTPKSLPKFSPTIDKIKFTPKISASPEGIFEFSQGSSTWMKPKKAIFTDKDHVNFLKPTTLFDNFYASTPIKSPPQTKTPSHLLHLDCSNLELETKEEREDSETFVLYDAESLVDISNPCKFQKNCPSNLHQSASIKKIPVLQAKLNKASKKKNPSIIGGKIANRSLGIKKKANLALKTEKKDSVTFHKPSDFMTNDISQDRNDEKWTFLQEVEFKKWLNALMTAPEHLNTDLDTASVDVGKVWQSCRMREEVILAESKESISARYHTNTRLNTLRKAANVIFQKDEVREAFSGATRCIENGSLVLKKDKDPHLDIGLQKEILELFLSYNPLWLRIGLETVYGETIPLQSNNDLIGLTRFLLARFFSDPIIVKKYSHPTIAGMKLSAFTSNMKNFMLKKFLQVVYFLDYAKMNKLIGHDPCLFRRNAQHKESRSILLTFSREVLSGIGDITKVLRLSGYVVNYKQAYLDEFDYAVNDISLDLRDGVRLCRTMELIRGKKNLTEYCRVPAISKLQKIHNVNIALTALLDSGYFVTGGIEAKCIVNGDRAKTLSLLWQIIYKFQAPRFEKAAICLQRWWRSKLWYVWVKNFLKKHRNEAASVIQKAWKFYLAKKELNQLIIKNEKNFEIRKKASWIIQEWWILHREAARERRKDFETLSTVHRIERWWRRTQETKPFVENLRSKLSASKTIQRWWRGILTLKRVRNEFLLMKHAVWVFEKRWIEKKIIREERNQFLRKRRNAIVIQKFWRRCKATEKEVSQFRFSKQSSRKIQSWWRMVMVFRKYQMKRKSSLKIQNWWRSLKEMKSCKIRYLRVKNAVLFIQKNWRMIRIMRKYRELKLKVITLQRRWRAKRLTEGVQKNYLKMKSAAVKIQSWFRMIKGRRKYENFLKFHKATIVIQSRWRAILDMRRAQAVYIKTLNYVIILQRKLRALQAGRLNRNKFLEAKKAILMIQKYWRCYAARKKYRLKKEAAIYIKNWWREVFSKKQLEVERANKLRLDNVGKMENWKEKTLSNKLQKAINVFLFSNDLGRLSMCLASLDLLTRLSANCCVTLCQVGLVDKIYKTLVQSNRSLPWMDVCIRATNILLTLVKYPLTKPFVLKEEYIETLARLLTVTVEKEVELFLHLATLMWFLVENPTYAKAVLENKRSSWLLKSLYSTINRKKNKLVRANPEAKEELLPNLKPDWGLKQQQPRLFSNIFYAATSISKRLSEHQQDINNNNKLRHHTNN